MVSSQGSLTMVWVLWAPYYVLAGIYFYAVFREGGVRKLVPALRGRSIMHILIVLIVIHTILRVSIHTFQQTTLIKYNGVPPTHLNREILKTVYMNGWTYLNILWGVKLAFLSVYWSMHQILTKKQIWFMYFVTFYVVATYFVHFFLLLFYCTPISLNWEEPPKYCSTWQSFDLNVMAVTMGMSTDIMTMILGWLVLRSLQLPSRVRKGGYMIFALGSVTVFATIIRLIAFVIQPATKNGQFQVQALGAVLVEVEVAIAAWVACLPSLRIFIRGSSRDTSGHNGSSGLNGRNNNYQLSKVGASINVGVSRGAVIQFDEDEESSLTEIMPKK